MRRMDGHGMEGKEKVKERGLDKDKKGWPMNRMKGCFVIIN